MSIGNIFNDLTKVVTGVAGLIPGLNAIGSVLNSFFRLFQKDNPRGSTPTAGSGAALVTQTEEQKQAEERRQAEEGGIGTTNSNETRTLQALLDFARLEQQAVPNT
jgi:hypothetical protein